MTLTELRQNIKAGLSDNKFEQLYACKEAAKERFLALIDEFASTYGTEYENVSLFSVPGRSELSGNHTDHNCGKVIAGSIDLDIIAVAAPVCGSTVKVKSHGYPEDVVDIESYDCPNEKYFGRSNSIIAGVADGLRKNGHMVGGFVAVTTSNVLKGSGLSSSAAFEDMIGTVFSHFYNQGSIGYVEIAQISQYAENRFFGKPCGLMDQVACACGGIVSIDFKDTSSPIIEKLDFDLTSHGYCLCIVNTGGNHADLTDDYAAVPAEMKAVAAHFGKKVLREVDEDSFITEIPDLRKETGDRAVMRALHFFAENRRVDLQREMLRQGDIEKYFELVRESGRSSFCYLQNVFTVKNVSEQGISLALCLTDRFYNENSAKGGFRVHGGGFAGTMQAYMPAELAEKYSELMNGVFGAGSCHILHIRCIGATKII